MRQNKEREPYHGKRKVETCRCMTSWQREYWDCWSASGLAGVSGGKWKKQKRQGKTGKREKIQQPGNW
ncbi:MAG: hypothetical protein ACLR79_05725 [Waltera sp.]